MGWMSGCQCPQMSQGQWNQRKKVKQFPFSFFSFVPRKTIFLWSGIELRPSSAKVQSPNQNWGILKAATSSFWSVVSLLLNLNLRDQVEGREIGKNTSWTPFIPAWELWMKTIAWWHKPWRGFQKKLNGTQLAVSPVSPLSLRKQLMNRLLCACAQSLSHVLLFVTLWTIAFARLL